MLHVKGFAADVSLDQGQNSLVAIDFRVRVDPVQRGRTTLRVHIYMEDPPAVAQRQALRQHHGRRGLVTPPLKLPIAMTFPSFPAGRCLGFRSALTHSMVSASVNCRAAPGFS